MVLTSPVIQWQPVKVTPTSRRRQWSAVALWTRSKAALARCAPSRQKPSDLISKKKSLVIFARTSICWLLHIAWKIFVPIKWALYLIQFHYHVHSLDFISVLVFNLVNLLHIKYTENHQTWHCMLVLDAWLLLPESKLCESTAYMWSLCLNVLILLPCESVASMICCISRKCTYNTFMTIHILETWFQFVSLLLGCWIEDLN